MHHAFVKGTESSLNVFCATCTKYRKVFDYFKYKIYKSHNPQ